MSGRSRRVALAGTIVLAAFMAFMCMGSFGAEATQSIGVSVRVPPTIQLSVAGGPVDYGDAVPGTPITDKVLSVGINSNKNWNLLVRKDHDLDNGAQTIASSAFLFRGENAGAGVTIDTGSYTEFGAANTQIANGTRGAGRSLDVRYSLTVPWDTEGSTDSYSATHTYTATQP
jgi:hypothetical protein